MAPSAKFDASIWTWNSNFQLGMINIGNHVTDAFIHSQDLAHAYVHINFSSFFSNLHISAALLAKSWK
jgi:hypothetical protein